MALNNNNNPYMNNMNFNQNAYNTYQNMFNNNPNFGMFNQMQLNQLLMNYIQNNPNLFFNNNPFQVNQQRFQAFQPVGNMNYMGTGVKGGNMPRPNQVNQRVFQNIDSYPGYNGPRVNVIFETSTGIKINMPTRRIKRQTLSKQRVKPVILVAKEKSNWNKVNKKENETKLQIDKSVKKTNFVLSKENEVLIENETEEILINDDYNIVEENYSRPIRANIRKIEDITEESVSSEYDILKNIHKHESQFNQFKELVSESIKINGQKVIINDVSGKYPRKVEIFRGLDENFKKFASEHAGQKKRLSTLN